MAAVTAVVVDDHDAETEAKRVLSTAAGWDENEEAARRFRCWLDDETKKLDLNCCNLIRLPNCIGNLTTLTILHCYGNRLTSLPDSIGDLNLLIILWCSYNPLTSLPQSLGYLPLLSTLECYYHKIPEGEPTTLDELQALARRRRVKGRTGC